jgi:amino acid transporter
VPSVLPSEQAKNPRVQVPKAIKSTFWRILFFYVGGILVVGLLVPSNSTQLLAANKAASNANASPFVVAIKLSGIKTLPAILNACVLLFVFCASSRPLFSSPRRKLTFCRSFSPSAAANSDLYIGSRTLFGLALEGQAPAIFKKVSKRGIPVPALAVCTGASPLLHHS